jgi:hypothetical protein
LITHAWRIIHIQGEQVLLCLLCDRYSWNPHDRANRYCGFCHEWLDIVPEDFRRLRHRPTEDADTIVRAINAREAASLEELRREAEDAP